MLKELTDRLTVLEQTAIIPVGLIAYCRGPVPNGWLLANGSVIDAARYGQLVTHLGGTTLPNLAGRFVVGIAAAGTFITIGGTGGAETVTLTGAQSGTSAHAHPAGTTGAGSAHSHGPGAGTTFLNVAAGGTAVINAAGTLLFPQSATTASEAAHTHSFTTPAAVAANASQAHANLPPYIILNPIIKV